MADISKIVLPSGNEYNIKDQSARDAIAALEGGSYFLGVTTSDISDGSTTNPITVGGQSVTAKNGNMVIKGNKEFVWAGESVGGHWVEFGDLSTLGDFAYIDEEDFNENVSTTLNKQTATALTGVKVTTQPTVALSTGASAGTGVISLATGVNKTNVKATASGGSVSASGTANVIGSSATMSTSVVTENADITIMRDTDVAVGANGTATVLKSDTPFSTTVTPTTTNVKATASGTAVGADGTATVLKSDTPFATTVTPSTTTIKEVDSAGSAPTWAFSVSSETLSISGGNGSATTTKNTTVATGISSASTTATTSGHTATALTGVKVTAQPTVALATGATAGTGVISVATGITSASTTATTSGHTASALTGVKVTTQPAFSASLESSDEGSVVTGIASASTTFSAKDQKNVVTGIGTMTQPTITLATGATAGTGVIEVATGATTTNVKATASGTAVGANGTATVLTNATTATTTISIDV